jgi:hypothetical protein
MPGLDTSVLKSSDHQDVQENDRHHCHTYTARIWSQQAGIFCPDSNARHGKLTGYLSTRIQHIDL